jgi:hypothetical protein
MLFLRGRFFALYRRLTARLDRVIWGDFGIHQFIFT